MRAIQSSVSLARYQQELADVLHDADCAVFLDTSLLAWSFRLNEVASKEFVRWLRGLASGQRLIIPAWVIHEYNHHLLRNDPLFFLPHKTAGKQLNSSLEEFQRLAHLMLSDESARELGYDTRESLLSAFSEASKTIQQCVAHLAKGDVRRRDKLITDLETLIVECVLKTNVHDLVATAAREAPARYANRLSPGYSDIQKTENSIGDLIIWKELLDHCKSEGIKKAALITNDRKPDWVYTPLSIILSNGSALSGAHPMARLVKLPKPDLVAEFEQHTGTQNCHIFSIEAVIEVLSSSELNSVYAQDFRHLALAISLDLARSPTEAVVQWFLKNPDKYEEALHGVCYWERDPAEVDLEAFRTWTIKEMKAVDAENVQWDSVFCEFFL